MNLNAQATRRFKKLLARAAKSRLEEPTAMALATAGRGGRPSVRMVLLKEVDSQGFVFYTNLKSRKGKELTTHPRAALCFFWEPLHTQVIVEGKVKLVSAKEADRYWASRSRLSQLGAWASRQSSLLESRGMLLKRLGLYAVRFAGRPIPRSPQWGGFRVVPDRMEFWSRRSARLHERQLYVKVGKRWRLKRLYP